MCACVGAWVCYVICGGVSWVCACVSVLCDVWVCQLGVCTCGCVSWVCACVGVCACVSVLCDVWVHVVCINNCLFILQAPLVSSLPTPHFVMLSTVLIPLSS